MKGIVMMMRALFEALGIQVSEQDATTIQSIIPTLPARIEQSVKSIDNWIQNFDARLSRIEHAQENMNLVLNQTLAVLTEINYATRRTSGNVQ